MQLKVAVSVMAVGRVIWGSVAFVPMDDVGIIRFSVEVKLFAGLLITNSVSADALIKKDV